MCEVMVEYLIGKSVSLARAKEFLRDNLELLVVSTEQVEITCMDSFDWRVYSASGVIESETENGSTLLRWRTLNSHDYLCSVETNIKIGFARNLPAGKMRKRLSKVLKVRALIPQVTLRVKRHHWVKLNKEQKTVIRVVLEDYQLWNEGENSFQRLENRIRLISVRGYLKPVDQADRLLKRSSIVAPVDEDIYLSALKALGRKPGYYKPKSIISLTPEMRTDEALKIALLSMLDILEANEDGVKNNIDPEFLHDFRIAVRKTRSAFSQIKGVFPKRTVERYGKQFSWLGTLTGPARDMDVYLLKLSEYSERLPVDSRKDLEPLRKVIVEKRISSYKSLSRGLEGKRYSRLTSDYRKFLTSPVPVHTRLPSADRPVKLVADKRIWKMYRRVMKEGQAIDEASPDEDLHELRKTCKKLRYLIEFFQSLYDPEQMGHLIETLKKLQDNLGDFNDLHVQIEKLYELEKDIEEQGPVSNETKEAISTLIDHLNSQQKEKRKEFSGRFHLFCAKENKQLYRQLFHSKSRTFETSPFVTK